MAAGSYRIHHQASLLGRNTLRVAARAERLIEISDPTAIPDILALPEVAAAPIRVLGSGSNLLLTADVPGTVLALNNADIHWPDPANASESVGVWVGAGCVWHRLVMESLERGWQGLENLALIPGTVGAAPIQNIGAYGLEVGERIDAVEVFDRQRRCFQTLLAGDCGFAYRDSVFKQQPDRYLVIAVQFRLHRHSTLRTHYQGIAEELAQAGITTATAQDVADAVIRLRRRKLPDPAVLPNAGSFFKNPWVDATTLERLRRDVPELVFWPGAEGGGGKLSAGWLIERAGLKGSRQGDAGIAPNHALVLVNHGQATGAELMAFAETIRAEVRTRFGVLLEPEPVRWP